MRRRCGIRWRKGRSEYFVISHGICHSVSPSNGLCSLWRLHAAVCLLAMMLCTHTWWLICSDESREKRSEGQKKNRGEKRPDGNLLGTVNTAWINLSERWQHEAWPGNKWAEGTYDGINRVFSECTVYISRIIRSIPDITQVRGILFYRMLMYACVYTCV